MDLQDWEDALHGFHPHRSPSPLKGEGEDILSNYRL